MSDTFFNSFLKSPEFKGLSELFMSSVLMTIKDDASSFKNLLRSASEKHEIPSTIVLKKIDHPIIEAIDKKLFEIRDEMIDEYSYPLAIDFDFPSNKVLETKIYLTIPPPPIFYLTDEAETLFRQFFPLKEMTLSNDVVLFKLLSNPIETFKFQNKEYFSASIEYEKKTKRLLVSCVISAMNSFLSDFSEYKEFFQKLSPMCIENRYDLETKEYVHSTAYYYATKRGDDFEIEGQNPDIRLDDAIDKSSALSSFFSPALILNAISVMFNSTDLSFDVDDVQKIKKICEGVSSEPVKNGKQYVVLSKLGDKK